MKRAWSCWWAVALLAVGCAPEPKPVSVSSPQGRDAPAAKSGAPAVKSDLPSPEPCSWPRFHGPKGDNLSTETGLLRQWPKDGPRLLWTAKGLGPGYASVAIAGGTIYTTGNHKDQSTVFALDMAGKILWQSPCGAGWTGSYPGMKATPTVEDDRLYIETPHGIVSCLNAKTGRPIWSVDILKEFEGKNLQWALAESILLDGPRAICCPGGNKGSVVALDKMTGKTVWAAKSTGDNAGYATPTLVEYQGLRIILNMTAKALIGVNADDGDLLFRHPHETSYDVNATTPLFYDGQVFITSGYGSGGEMLRIKVDGKKASLEKLWDAKQLDNHHGGVILLDGCIYGCSYGPKWICLDWQTGKVLYAERGVGKGSLTYADGMLYTLSEKRAMGLVEANPKAHKVVSQFKLPPGGEGESWAHPVVCGARLYLRHGDALFCYQVKADK